VLAEGSELSERQRPAFERSLEAVRVARLRALYDEARALERDFQFELAVARYGELIEQAGFFEDAITRRDTLQGFIALAADLYARALVAPSAEEALPLLRQIEVFWPEYRDVRERVLGGQGGQAGRPGS
jgi:hypothetical protein